MSQTPLACADVDPELFFWLEDTPEGCEPCVWERAALAVCSRCPVAGECLARALAFPGWDQHGVVGGMTAGQRRALLRRPAVTEPERAA